MKSAFVTLAILAMAGMAMAVTPTIDGLQIDPNHWGPTLSIQDTNTQFGDNENELNQMFITSDNDNIYIGFPGNIADNNALTIFFDINLATGSHPLATDPGAVPCQGAYPRILRYYEGALLSDPNLPAVFTPDYALTISVGKFPGQSDTQLVHACDVTDLGDFSVTVLGIGAVGSGDGVLTGAAGARVAIDNSNVDGVGGWFDPNGHTPAETGDDPTDTDTGIEIAIPRALVGLDVMTPTDLSVFAYISNNAQDTAGIPGICGAAAYGSNQAMPGLAGWGNMAGFNGVEVPLDISANPGLNFAMTVIPGVGP